MNKSTTTFFLLFSFCIPIAQNTVADFVEEGIQLHDNGNYDGAIDVYNNALLVEPKSTLVNYEISLSYFMKGDYNKAIEYSNKVIESNSNHLLQAYLTKGSCLDNLGKTKQSIKLFKKGIKKFGYNYLLNYNLALNYYKLKNYKEAEWNVTKAIELNSEHVSSHLLLGYILNETNKKVQSLLSLHYFLFLEPDSKRAEEAFTLLLNNFGGNVTKDKDKPNTINISLLLNDDSQFGAAELMISLLEASKSLEENVGKTDEEMFIENTKSFFTILGELRKRKDKDIYWDFYTPFFYKIAKSDFIETYCYYISQVGNEKSRMWLDSHPSSIEEFGKWLYEK